MVAVKDLSIAIEDGEFVVFVGPSGCGKTTTLRMIAGFEDPTAGEIASTAAWSTISSRATGASAWCSRATRSAQDGRAEHRVRPAHEGVPVAERRKRVAEVAEMVRISHLLDKMPAQCSGGESQRVALARTLVTNPSTFLLDEPLSSLDAKLRRELRAECDRLHEELRRTFIYVTHDQEEAMTLADRIVVMRSGEIEQIGSHGDLLRSGELFRRRFLRIPVDEPGCRGVPTQAAGAPRFRSRASRCSCRSDMARSRRAR